jgi:ornithine--oxo-acid transaminase
MLLESADLARAADEQGAYLVAELHKLGHPAIVAIRGKGLLLGVQIDPRFASARDVCEGLMGEGVLSKDTHRTVVRLAPPLIIERAQIDLAVSALQRVLHALEPARRERKAVAA